jgi:hypothetical protein
VNGFDAFHGIGTQLPEIPHDLENQFYFFRLLLFEVSIHVRRVDTLVAIRVVEVIKRITVLGSVHDVWLITRPEFPLLLDVREDSARRPKENHIDEDAAHKSMLICDVFP